SGMPTTHAGDYCPVPETIPADRNLLRRLHPARFLADAQSLTIFQSRTTSGRTDTVLHRTRRCLRDRAVRESSSVPADPRLTMSESAAGVVLAVVPSRWIEAMHPAVRYLYE